MTDQARADRGAGTRSVLVNIQALRALAALMVVVHHLGDMVEAVGIPRRHLEFGALGVDLFFVISGFIMVFTTDRAPTTGGRFMLNRIARIVPLYWLMTLLVFAVALAMPSLLRSTVASPLDLLRSLAFIPYMRADGQMMPVLFLGWSLNYEMFFYAVFAVALAVGRGRHVALSVLVIVALVALGWMVHLSGSTLGFYTNTKMIEFAAGMLLARALPHLPGNRAVAALALAVGCLWLMATPWLFTRSVATLNAAGACTLIVAAVLCAERAGLVLGGRGLVLLGDASYSLYLVHPLVTQAVTALWRRLADASPLAALAAIPLALGLTVVAAVLCYRLVEAPLARAARSLLGARRSAVPAGGL